MHSQELISQFYETFWVLFAGCLLPLIISILLFIFRKKLFTEPRYENMGNWIKYTVIGLLLIMSSYFGIQFSAYVRDLSNVRNEEFLTLEGEVLYFIKETESNTPGEPNQQWPVFLDELSGKEIAIDIHGDVELGEYYKVLYLENSKLGVLIPEQGDE